MSMWLSDRQEPGQPPSASLVCVTPAGPYLVVDHHVHGAIGGVRGQVAQVEGLIDHTLASKGSISMDQDGHDL